MAKGVKEVYEFDTGDHRWLQFPTDDQSLFPLAITIINSSIFLNPSLDLFLNLTKLFFNQKPEQTITLKVKLVNIILIFGNCFGSWPGLAMWSTSQLIGPECPRPAGYYIMAFMKM